jgi:hypothetical protein
VITKKQSHFDWLILKSAKRKSEKNKQIAFKGKLKNERISCFSKLEIGTG